MNAWMTWKVTEKRHSNSLHLHTTIQAGLTSHWQNNPIRLFTPDDFFNKIWRHRHKIYSISLQENIVLHIVFDYTLTACCTVWYQMLLYGIVWCVCGMVRVARYNMIRHAMALYNVIWYDMVLYCVVWSGITWYDMIKYV